MNASAPHDDPASAAPPLADEADIGSGEPPPGHAETEELIRQIPPLPDSGPANTAPDNNATQQPGAGPANPGRSDPERADEGSESAGETQTPANDASQPRN